jgi:hypothetical protein
MITRCTNQSRWKFSYYGGAGVSVNPRWLDHEDGFKNFLSDMKERPLGTTLGRYLDMGNYEPGNCKWMTLGEQGAEMCKKNILKKAA